MSSPHTAKESWMSTYTLKPLPRGSSSVSPHPDFWGHWHRWDIWRWFGTAGKEWDISIDHMAGASVVPCSQLCRGLQQFSPPRTIITIENAVNMPEKTESEDATLPWQLCACLVPGAMVAVHMLHSHFISAHALHTNTPPVCTFSHLQTLALWWFSGTCALYSEHDYSLDPRTTVTTCIPLL